MMKEKEAYSGLNFSLDLLRYPQPSPSKTYAQSQDVQFHPVRLPIYNRDSFTFT